MCLGVLWGFLRAVGSLRLALSRNEELREALEEIISGPEVYLEDNGLWVRKVDAEIESCRFGK